MAAKSRGAKFPLLIYRRWAGMLRLPALLLAAAAGVIWWFAPNHPLLAERDWVFIVIAAAGALIFLYSLWVRQTAYVQCFPAYVKIRTPFFSVAVSYKRIRHVRPVEYHAELPWSKLKYPQRRLLQPFLKRHVVVLELDSFPIGERRLRTWIPWFMLSGTGAGFILVVEDWMALSRQISAFSDRWFAERQARKQSPGGRFF